MKLIVNPHKIEIIKDLVNEREIDITKCEFEFADEITAEYVKEAYFTFKGVSYKQLIINNECDIPNEVLAEKGQVEIGVVAYLIEDEEEIKRYNPSPAYFNTLVGSLKDKTENTEPITPTDKEQIEQAIANLEADKQDKLTAGDNITIENNVISAVDTIYDDTEIRSELNNKVDKVQGKGLSTNDYTNEEKTKLANLENYDDTEIKSDISNLQTNKADKSEIPDVSNFVTRSVNDLVNYYLKSETYTKTEVNNLIGSIEHLHFEIVEQLPSTGSSNIIYLVPRSESEESNVYDEYIYISNNWEKIGSTDIDLSGYVTTSDLNTALANYTTTTDLNTLLSGKQNTIDSSHKLSSDLVDDTNNTNKFVTSVEKTTWNGKVSQEELNQSQAVQDTKISYVENITDQLPKTSGIGAEVTLDTIEAEMSVGVKGNTEQDGTPTPSSPLNIKVATGNNTILISNSDNTESQTYTINLGNITLCGLGDYRDYFYKDEDKWYLYKTVDKKVYNGSTAEGWFKYSTNSFSSGKISSVRKSLCDYYEFKEGKTTATSLLDGEYCYASSTNNYAILIKNSNYDDVNSFKTWLSTHNITIYYVLETPTTTEITDTTLISQLNAIEEAMSYANQTNLSSTYESGNAPLFINAEAFSDIEKELDEKVDDVQVNGTSIVNGGVANIPIAEDSTTGNYGLVKLYSAYGLSKVTSGTYAGTMAISPAAVNGHIKPGTNMYKPIVPAYQDASAFYGLAKASGDTTQASSSNPVGTYTDTAKTKIQEMFGIVTLTQAEYDSIAVKSDATIYIIVED